MRRTLILITSILVLLAAVFLVSFSASKYNVGDQSYFTSLDDYLFMIGSYMGETFNATPPKLNDFSYRSIINRFRKTAHYEVKDRAVWRLKQWGDDVVTRLIYELGHSSQYDVLEGVAEALAEIGHPDAVENLAALLRTTADDPQVPPRLRISLVKALGKTGNSDAAAPLIEYYNSTPSQMKVPDDYTLEAIAQSGGGREFLLALLDQSSEPDHIHSLLWPLAMSRDPVIAERMSVFLKHPVNEIRQRTRDAMDQSMGPAAIDPALDILEQVADDHVKNNIINMILDDWDARSNPRVVPILSKYLNHPTLSWVANYAMARMRSPEAIAAIVKHSADKSPQEVMNDLEYSGAAALEIFSGYLQHDDPSVRRAAIYKLETLNIAEAAESIEPLLNDDDKRVARGAKNALLRLDKALLRDSFVESLPPAIGKNVSGGFYQSSRKGFRQVWSVFSIIHKIGTAIAVFLGLMLILNKIRSFESYRFNLFIQFLLIEGFVGDFFLMNHDANDIWFSYLLSTAAHLFLLIGFFFKQRQLVPGDTRNRFERLGGASLWVLVPGLLFFGTPLIAEALRISMREWSFMWQFLALLGITSALVFEQWIVPWNSLVRGARVRRLLSGSISVWIFGLFTWSLFRLFTRLQDSGDGDRAVFALLLILPLLWMLVFHLYSIGIFRRSMKKVAIKQTPGERLSFAQGGDSISIRIKDRSNRVILPKLIQIAMVFAAGGAAGLLAGQNSSGALGMFTSLIIAVIGAAVAVIIIEAFRPRTLIQTRNGFVRTGTSTLGGVFNGGNWRKKLVFTLDASDYLKEYNLPEDVKSLDELRAEYGRSKDPDALTKKEKRWIHKVIDLAAAKRTDPFLKSSEKLSLTVEDMDMARVDPESGIPVQLKVTNEGAEPISPAEIEESARKKCWKATANDIKSDLFFSRNDLERTIAPGATEVLTPRVYLPDQLQDQENINLKISCNEIWSESRLVSFKSGGAA